MSAPVKLRDVMDELEMTIDERSSFLDRETGEVHNVTSDLLRKAEVYQEGDEEPDLPDWQYDEWESALLIQAHFPGRMVRLPTQFDLNEWEVMREFVDTVKSDHTRAELQNAIHGKGAFRYFKDIVHRHHIEKDWYAFRETAIREFAIDWCEENDVTWTES